MKETEITEGYLRQLGPRQSKQVLTIFAKTLNRYQYASPYLQWLEQSIMEDLDDDGDLATDLTVEQVLRHIETMQDKCELVKRMYQNMLLDVKKLARNYRNRNKTALYLDETYVMSLGTPN